MLQPRKGRLPLCGANVRKAAAKSASSSTGRPVAIPTTRPLGSATQPSAGPAMTMSPRSGKQKTNCNRCKPARWSIVSSIGLPSATRLASARSSPTSDTFRSFDGASRLPGSRPFAAASRSARNLPPGSSNVLRLSTPSASTATPNVGSCTVVAGGGSALTAWLSGSPQMIPSHAQMIVNRAQVLRCMSWPSLRAVGPFRKFIVAGARVAKTKGVAGGSHSTRLQRRIVLLECKEVSKLLSLSARNGYANRNSLSRDGRRGLFRSRGGLCRPCSGE